MLYLIECYYFKLAPNANSRDLTFKEYALMDVSDVKHIKLIINDNQIITDLDMGLYHIIVKNATFILKNIIYHSSDIV